MTQVSYPVAVVFVDFLEATDAVFIIHLHLKVSFDVRKPLDPCNMHLPADIYCTISFKSKLR